MSPTPAFVRVRVAAIVVQEDELLLVRHEKEGETYWMLPGGGVDLGEALPTALCRELREEVSVECTIGSMLMANDSIAPDHHRHVVNLYFEATITSGTPRLGSDSRIVEVAFKPIAKLHTLPMRPDLATTFQALLAMRPRHFAGYQGNIWRD